MEAFPFTDDAAFWEHAAQLADIYQSIRQWTEEEGTTQASRRLRHYFQFLSWNSRDEPSALDRWNQMAQVIQDHFGRETRGHFGFEFIPADERGDPRQRTWTRIDRVTGQIMAEIYESMLQSQENLYLEGFTVKVGVLGEGMRNAMQGSGKTLGSSHIKDTHLKGRGLATHPQEDKLDKERLAGYCGPRALLLARDTDRYTTANRAYTKPRAKKLVFEWADDAEALAKEMGMKEDGVMTDEHVQSLVALDGWRNKRIVVLTRLNKPHWSFAGEEWAWPEQPRIQPDPHTIYLLHYKVGDNGHWWWVQCPKQFLGRTNKDKKYTICYVCCEGMNIDEAERHECSLIGTPNYQCGICRSFFCYKEGLDAHKELKLELEPCGDCGQRFFNGPMCFQDHLRRNCKITKLPPGVRRERCPICWRPFRTDIDHHCDDYGDCRNCKETFASRDDKLKHRCYLQPLDEYWSPVKMREGPNGELLPCKFEVHWTYDFETNRGKQLAPNVFRHQVMAWSVYLVIPDDETKEMMEQLDFFSHTHKLFEATIGGERMIGWDQEELEKEGRIRMFGMELEAFLYVVENILVTKIGKVAVQPTLWAHNGSKFDAKFVMDRYLNVERLDLAGASYKEDWSQYRLRVREGDVTKWKEIIKSQRRDVVKTSAVGSKILSLKVRGATFRCSHAHLAAPLRDLPKMFGLGDIVKKGDFPYALLNENNWEMELEGMPALKLYDVESMEGGRRLKVAQEWVEMQKEMGVAPDVIRAGLEEAGVTELEVEEDYMVKDVPDKWNFADNLWGYLWDDVKVLAKCLEAYHKSVVQIHEEIWKRPEYSLRQGKLVSPLSSATSPSFAYKMYRTWFLPRNRIAILKPDEARFIRSSLRGGRTDKRANYIKLTEERMRKGDYVGYYDFCSLYPSVMKCEVHDTHYPVGAPKHRVFNRFMGNKELIREMRRENKTGFLKVNTRSIKYVTHPTLHHKGSIDPDSKEEKLLFANSDTKDEIYAWPELLEAINSGEVEVTFVHDAYLFEKGSDLFDKYIDLFFEIKAKARKLGNAGMEALAKLLLNSLWGKLAQRSYATREWVTSKSRMDYLLKKFDEGHLELKRFVDKEPHRAWFEYTDPNDPSNLDTTAVHVGAFVAMGGRVTLHKKILRKHGQRVLYSDTDSAIIYMRAGDKVDDEGEGLGQLQNEVEKILKKAGYKKGVDFIEPLIKEAVFVAPKTYALRLGCRVKSALKYDKVVCKGFEPSFSNRKEIHFDSMKALVWTANGLKEWIGQKRGLDEEETRMKKVNCLEDRGRLTFWSSVATNEMVPTEKWVTKKMYGTYTKGLTMEHEPRLVKPFGLDPPTLETFLDFVDDSKHYE